MKMFDRPKSLFECDICKNTFPFFNDETNRVYANIQFRSTIDSVPNYKPVYLCPECTKELCKSFLNVNRG